MYVADVDLRQERRQAQLDLGGGGQRLVEHRLAAGLERLHRVLEHVQIQGQPDLGHLAALLLTEQFTGAADLEVMGREDESRSQLLHRLDRLQTLDGVARQRLARRRDQVRVGAVV